MPADDTFSTIEIARDGHVLTATLNRPERLNAVDGTMHAELEHFFADLAEDDDVGLGATIALFCDVVLAADTARLGDTHVNVGLVAGDGGAVIWPLLVGVNRAKELLMTGDLLTAADAERLGLVNHVHPAGELLPAARAMAERLAAAPTAALRYTKQAVNKLLRERMVATLDTSLAFEAISASAGPIGRR